MPQSVAKQILAALDTRLKTILIASGYNTDAGLRVYRGRKSFDWGDPAQFPAISVFDPSDVCEAKHEERNDIALAVHVEAHGFADAANPTDLAHDLVADIKTALFKPDQTLGGLVASIEYKGRDIQLPEEDAGSVVSVRVVADIKYPELYGDPYTVLE